MIRNQALPAGRSESDDLRQRSDRLREKSRDLRQRSQASREFVPGAAQRRLDAAAGNAGPVDRAAEFRRLLRAQADLECAISHCGLALEEVRRELRWADIDPTSIVH